MDTLQRGLSPRASIVNEAGFAARSPTGDQLITLTPTRYNLLTYLDRLAPTDVARYEDVARATWPNGAYPSDLNNAIQWHAGLLNKLLVVLGWQPEAIKIVPGVGLRFNPIPAQEHHRTITG